MRKHYEKKVRPSLEQNFMEYSSKTLSEVEVDIDNLGISDEAIADSFDEALDDGLEVATADGFAEAIVDGFDEDSAGSSDEERAGSSEKL